LIHQSLIDARDRGTAVRESSIGMMIVDEYDYTFRGKE
jgi:hypothetical protein